MERIGEPVCEGALGLAICLNVVENTTASCLSVENANLVGDMSWI